MHFHPSNPSRRHFWSGKSSFGRTPRHAGPFDKKTVRPTEFRCCSGVAPTVWNALPSQLRSSSISRGQFRDGLKTHLFTQATDTSELFFEERIILHYITYSATSKNMKLVHWPLMGGLRAVRFGTARRGLGGASACPGPCSLYQM